MRSRKPVILILFFLVFTFVANASGMNRVILKQGDGKGGTPLLKQEMFYRMEGGKRIPLTNTIFIIQSDFNLAEDITVPSGCVLEFEGGSLRKGKINTNGCYIDAGLYQVFENVVFNSINTYNGQIKAVDNIYIRVLEGNSFVNKKTNSLIAANSVVNRRYTYKITGKSTNPQIEGKSVTISLNGQKYTIADITSDNKYKLKYNYARVIGITNSTGEMASGIVNSLKGVTFYTITPISYNFNSTVKNKEIHPEWFGAKGDNKNDDSYAYNSALDLAYYSDSKVVIGNGVYRIDDALVIHTHTNLVGVVPTVDHPVKGCFAVNTDIAMLVFDQYNPSGSYILENFGFIPYSDGRKTNYTGIKIYHSQNLAHISNIGFYYPLTGIDIDAIGGVQLLRCEDINLWGEENKGIVAVNARYRLGGWFNANYIRPAFIAHSTVIKCEGGGDNTLDGGSTETNGYSDYLIELDKNATLLVRGGLYKETGKIAKVRNSSKLIFEGDNFFYGNVDCDGSSYVVYPRNIQSRQDIINNSVIVNDVVIAHYKVFSRNTKLWFESINKNVVKPLELADNYQSYQYNGRLFASGKCIIPMGDIDIRGKTIAIRFISPTVFLSKQRSYPFSMNTVNNNKPTSLSLGRSISLENASVLYAPEEVNLGDIERGERYVFLPSKQEKYILSDFTTDGNPSFLISDIYVINKDSKDIKGNEKIRIIDVLNSLDSYTQEDGLFNGYNKGASSERPTFLTKADAGFEYFDTTLNKQLYWTGDTPIGEKGWVDALGRHPNSR